MNRVMKVVIVGVGAMACLFASFLHQLGESVELVLLGSWQQQIDKLNRDGLIVQHLDGSVSCRRIRATARSDQLRDYDFAFLLTKSYLTRHVGPLLAQVLKPDGLVITLQNGLGNVRILSEHIPKSQILAAVTSQAAMLPEPGTVVHTGSGMTYLPHAGLKQTGRLLSRLPDIGTPLTYKKNMNNFIWGKLAINAAINPLTALLEVSNGQLLENPIWRKVMRATVLEVKRVAAAVSVKLPFEDIESETEHVCQKTARNSSSMLQDIRRGAPTEIDFISGAVVRPGKRGKVATPFNEFMLKYVTLKEQGGSFDIEYFREIF